MQHEATLAALNADGEKAGGRPDSKNQDAAAKIRTDLQRQLKLITEAA
jgi:hypothetical protein